MMKVIALMLAALICANGTPCRKVIVGKTQVVGASGQKLFTELVTAEPGAFESEMAFRKALAMHDVEVWDRGILGPSKPELCAHVAGAKILDVAHRKLLRGQGLWPEYQAHYVVVIGRDSSVLCVENQFSYTGP